MSKINRSVCMTCQSILSTHFKVYLDGQPLGFALFASPSDTERPGCVVQLKIKTRKVSPVSDEEEVYLDENDPYVLLTGHVRIEEIPVVERLGEHHEH